MKNNIAEIAGNAVQYARLRAGELSLRFVTWNNPEQVMLTLNYSGFPCEVDEIVPALLHCYIFFLLK